MAWQYCNKQIEVTGQTPHICTLPHTDGSPLATTTFDFTADEFHLAAAVCSHMHPVAANAAGPEASMIRALVAEHVDDIRPDFAVEASADSFKDFVKSYFSGTVGTGLAYLAMIRSGYNWAGHFEHLKPASTTGRTPDFVFAAEGKGTCLVESKGTRSAGRSPFDDTVEEGYLEQVERHLGVTLANGARASHGYCVGAWMTSVSKAELLVHHTATDTTHGRYAPAGGGGVADDGGRSLALVQQQDVATALSLALGTPYGGAIRNNGLEIQSPLLKFTWLDRQWITGGFPYLYRVLSVNGPEAEHHWVLHWDEEGMPFQRPIFAVESTIAKAVFAHFWGQAEPGSAIEGLEPLNPEIIFRAREEGQGAVLPDGLALIRRSFWSKVRPTRWDPQARKFL